MAQTRIGHFIETEIAGGAEQVLIDLARYANSKTHNFQAVVLHFGHPWIAEQCESHGLEHIAVPFYRNFKSTIRLPLFAWEFGRWLKKQRIDLLHSHLFGPVTGGALAATVARIPHVGTLHDVYMIQEKPARIHLVWLATLFGTHLVTVSKDMEEFYRSKAPFRKHSITTIYNGIDFNDASATESSEGNPLSIICVGRLVSLKNIDLIIRATLLLAKRSNVQLYILGEGPERQNLESLVPEDSKDIIHFPGVSRDVLAWLRKSDIFVQFSSTEGLSRSVIEATAAGLPTVVSDVGGNREIVEHNWTGFVVPSGDSEGLIESISKLLNDSELRHNMGERGKQRAKKLFSRTINNDQYIQLYQQLLFH
ncbi:glycosyltransferase [Marinobacter sp. CHS3-4]|uniref:glycosyltransferase n=1 Tax=Marinobacter sp. CHS3-4 TaxID=3045174 RepID=UPI0024B4A41A|nr:glycosyltransferase [Marinobacter sp. CHS3-4]MDI9245569.1 glycosyltransferase [Marinobacter sp. CHS3-4]